MANKCKAFITCLTSIDTVSKFKCGTYMGISNYTKSSLTGDGLIILNGNQIGKKSLFIDRDDLPYVDGSSTKMDEYNNKHCLYYLGISDTKDGPEGENVKYKPYSKDKTNNYTRDCINHKRNQRILEPLLILIQNDCNSYSLQSAEKFAYVDSNSLISLQNTMAKLYDAIKTELNSRGPIGEAAAELIPDKPDKGKSKIEKNIFLELNSALLKCDSTIPDLDIKKDYALASESINALITSYNTFISTNTCKCFKDCNSYSVCFCYANCNYSLSKDLDYGEYNVTL